MVSIMSSTQNMIFSVSFKDSKWLSARGSMDCFNVLNQMQDIHSPKSKVPIILILVTL
jgi:hypothetical protein